ncbi:MAG: flagellar motor protein MotB [Chromatiaceae bacterium]
MTKKCAQSSAPAWVTTFADLCTLLLSFFVLLFSFSEVDKAKYKEVAGSMQDAFGVQREIRTMTPPRGVNVIAREFSPGIPSPTALNEIRQFTTDDYMPYARLPQSQKAPDEPRDQKKLDEDKIRLALENEISAGLVELEVEDRKIIVRIKEKGAFPSGSARLERPFRPVVDRLARALKDTNGEIAISGHTDSVPIANSEFHSNWELSSARAVTVAQVFFDNGAIPDARIHLEAYADTRPVDTNESSHGRARNRRVEIAIEYGDGKVSETNAH